MQSQLVCHNLRLPHCSGHTQSCSSGHWNWIPRTCYSRLTAATLAASTISHYFHTVSLCTKLTINRHHPNSAIKLRKCRPAIPPFCQQAYQEIQHTNDIPTKIGERSFTYAGPAAWNTVPHYVHEITDPAVYTAQSSYVSAVLGILILFFCLSVTRVLCGEMGCPKMQFCDFANNTGRQWKSRAFSVTAELLVL